MRAVDKMLLGRYSVQEVAQGKKVFQIEELLHIARLIDLVTLVGQTTVEEVESCTRNCCSIALMVDSLVTAIDQLKGPVLLSLQV